MKVLLVKCPRHYQSHFEENSESLALAYIGAALRQHCNDTEILDASLLGLSLGETIARILEEEYDLIGFTVADPTFIESSFRVIGDVRKKGTRSHITMGGHAPTFHYKEVLGVCSGLDSIVMYEGERTIAELVACLKQGRDWREIKGIAYKSNGTIKCNHPRPLISNLDSLPFPARDTLSFLLKHQKETGVVSMSGGRGCYMNCGFCSIKAFYTDPKGSPWRFRGNNNIADEMEYLAETFGVREILFVDDVFVGPGENNIKRVSQLADEIEKRKLKIMISISERVDNINEDLFKRLKQVGLRQILLGVESGSQEILNYFNKGITPQQIQEAIEILQHLDIDVTVAFINFTPVTTLEQLRENLDFFLSLRVNVLQGLLNRFQIYGGTPLGEKLQKQGLVKGRFPHFSYCTPDGRVDVVYEIVQRSLGTFLSTAYELKALERILRIGLFKTEVEGRTQEGDLLRIEKRRYRGLMSQIMKEATEVFRQIIDFAEATDAQNTEKVEKFTEEMIDISASTYKNWLTLIRFFRDFSPGLRSSAAFVEKDLANQRKEIKDART